MEMTGNIYRFPIQCYLLYFLNGEYIILPVFFFFFPLRNQQIIYFKENITASQYNTSKILLGQPAAQITNFVRNLLKRSQFFNFDQQVASHLCLKLSVYSSIFEVRNVIESCVGLRFSILATTVYPFTTQYLISAALLQ